MFLERRCWEFDHIASKVYLATGPLPSGVPRLERHAAEFQVRRLVRSILRPSWHDIDEWDRRRLLDVWSAVGGNAGSRRPAYEHDLSASWFVDEVAERLEWAVFCQRLAVGKRLMLAHRTEVVPEVPVVPAPASTEAWIAVRIVDGEGAPVPRRSIRLSRQGTVVYEGFLDDAGYVHVDDVPAGTLTLTLPDLDASEFGVERPAPGKLDPDHGPVVAADGPGMVVSAGENATLGSIAQTNFRMHWVGLWNDSVNQALRAAREHPHCLLPGDEVRIPPIVPRELSVETDREHRLKVLVQMPYLRLRLVDLRGRPRAGVACVLRVEGAEHALVTDGEGKVEVPVLPSTTDAELEVDDERLPVAIGGLGPLGERVGVEGRLVDGGLLPELEPLCTGEPLEAALVDELTALGVERLERQEHVAPKGEVTDGARDLLRRKVSR